MASDVKTAAPAPGDDFPQHFVNMCTQLLASQRASVASINANMRTNAATGGVAYGSPAVRRRSRLSRLATWLKTPVMLALIIAGWPAAVAASWVLCPLWFVPLHEWSGWGAVDMADFATGCGIMHGLMGAGVWLALILVTFARRYDDDFSMTWWWDPQPDAKD